MRSLFACVCTKDDGECVCVNYCVSLTWSLPAPTELIARVMNGLPALPAVGIWGQATYYTATYRKWTAYCTGAQFVGMMSSGHPTLFIRKGHSHQVMVCAPVFHTFHHLIEDTLSHLIIKNELMCFVYNSWLQWMVDPCAALKNGPNPQRSNRGQRAWSGVFCWC